MCPNLYQKKKRGKLFMRGLLGWTLHCLHTCFNIIYVCVMKWISHRTWAFSDYVHNCGKSFWILFWYYSMKAHYWNKQCTCFSLWCHQMRRQCGCSLKDQIASHLPKWLVLCQQHRNPAKYTVLIQISYFVSQLCTCWKSSSCSGIRLFLLV